MVKLQLFLSSDKLGHIATKDMYSYSTDNKHLGLE